MPWSLEEALPALAAKDPRMAAAIRAAGLPVAFVTPSEYEQVNP